MEDDSDVDRKCRKSRHFLDSLFTSLNSWIK